MRVFPLRCLPLGAVASISLAAVVLERPEAAAARASLIGSVELVMVAPPQRTVLGSGVYAPVSSEVLLPVCETRDDGEPLPTLREGCPQAPPGVGSCEVEGLGCSYPARQECRARFECVYALWSPLGDACPEGEPWRANPLRGSGECEALRPIGDTPCESEGLVCGYVPCPLGEAPQFEAECRCGRWYVRQNSCAID